jgi:hypothetical protein
MWKSAAPPQSKSVLAVENTLFLLAGAHVGKNSVNVELGNGVLAFVAQDEVAGAAAYTACHNYYMIISHYFRDCRLMFSI